MLRLFRELRRGSTKVLILSQLGREPMYGYQIVKAIRDKSSSYFDLSEGSLYPALHSLEKQKLIRGDWRDVEGRSRKYYTLTPEGKKFLREALKEWELFSTNLWDLVGPERKQAGAR
jgi:DNA-binding PadR family transcriptional regulator